MYVYVYIYIFLSLGCLGVGVCVCWAWRSDQQVLALFHRKHNEYPKNVPHGWPDKDKEAKRNSGHVKDDIKDWFVWTIVSISWFISLSMFIFIFPNIFLWPLEVLRKFEKMPIPAARILDILDILHLDPSAQLDKYKVRHPQETIQEHGGLPNKCGHGISDSWVSEVDL